MRSRRNLVPRDPGDRRHNRGRLPSRADRDRGPRASGSRDDRPDSCRRAWPCRRRCALEADLLDSQLEPRARARDPRIEVAADEAAEAHGEHRCVSEPDQAVEPPSGVCRADDRKQETGDDVHVEPCRRAAEASQPPHALTKRIEPHEHEQSEREEARGLPHMAEGFSHGCSGCRTRVAIPAM
jgi:hypothetical protein